MIPRGVGLIDWFVSKRNLTSSSNTPSAIHAPHSTLSLSHISDGLYFRDLQGLVVHSARADLPHHATSAHSHLYLGYSYLDPSPSRWACLMMCHACFLFLLSVIYECDFISRIPSFFSFSSCNCLSTLFSPSEKNWNENVNILCLWMGYDGFIIIIFICWMMKKKELVGGGTCNETPPPHHVHPTVCFLFTLCASLCSVKIICCPVGCLVQLMANIVEYFIKAPIKFVKWLFD